MLTDLEFSNKKTLIGLVITLLIVFSIYRYNEYNRIKSIPLKVTKRACIKYKVTWKDVRNDNVYLINIKRYDNEGNELFMFKHELGTIRTTNRGYFNFVKVGKTYRSINSITKR